MFKVNNDVDVKSLKLFNKQSETHFSKNLLEIFNKLIVSASLITDNDANCLINSNRVYKLLEVCLCDFYIERYAFNRMLGLKILFVK